MRRIIAALVCILPLASAPAGPPGPPDPGEDCEQAIPVTPPAVITGDTRDYTSEPDWPPCGQGWESPSVWFSVMGNGSWIRASACNDTFFDSILVLFAGHDCANLECVTAVDDACGLGPIIEWTTQPGQRYLVVLRGVFFSGGRFTLVFETDATEDCDADGVPDATQIAADPTLDCFGPGPAGAMGGPDGRLDRCQCSADWTRDGSVTSTDISGFLTSWLAALQGGGAGADLDCSGATNSTDIAVYLTRWLASITGSDPADGCP